MRVRNFPYPFLRGQPLKTGTDGQKRVELTVQLELHTPKTQSG